MYKYRDMICVFLKKCIRVIISIPNSLTLKENNKRGKNYSITMRGKYFPAVVDNNEISITYKKT